ncbi:hypothetical protein EV368DRAFT_70253 [Lentinula lateritia]|nr:hypothetical protein EV368DRAFT_70253 [Lentinula lateritia]
MTWSLRESAPVAVPREFSIQGNATTLATRGTQTYYRAIKLDDNTSNKVGTHPTQPGLKAGDFSNQWGYYMFPDKENAMFWGNQHKNDASHQFGVVELDFSLPTGVTSYSFPSANPEWTTVRPGSELVLRIVADLPMECKPGKEVPGSGGSSRHPQVWEVVTEKRHVKAPELVEHLGSLGRFGGGWLTKTMDVGEL